LTVGFRPQLVVVSGLSVGIPLTVGFRLLRSLRLSWSLFTNSSSFHDRILAITKPFTRTFSFTWWNLGYHGAFSRIFLSHGRILAIKKPFTRTFLFHDEILAIKEPFTRTFLFHDGILAIKKPFTRTFLFHDGILEMHYLGEESFHIYHKEYLHRIRLVKNLAS
jgi:hypothetical protein